MLNISEKLVRIIKVHGAGSIAGGVEVEVRGARMQMENVCV